MSKIWYCATCGYEVESRGRCHQCREKLIASPLPELAPGADDDEVGYRLDDWADALRGQLIGQLITDRVAHRFEDDELVVAVDDEDRVDVLVAELAGGAELLEEDEADDAVVGYSGDGFEDDDADPEGPLPAGITPEVALLASAAARLERDPTDMQADAEASETSTSVFLIDEPPDVDGEDWNAVGRVTRRLMAALGADEALEDEIRLQAGVLNRLLGPIVDPRAAARAATPVAAGQEQSETVYELGEWLPEQRAELAFRLDGERIPASWDGPNLVVASDREDAVEGVLDRIEAVQDPDADEEATYRALEELFAATDRFVGDPSDQTRGKEVVRAVGVADGSTPVGLDDAQWWQIRQRARILADSIEHKAQKDVVLSEARTLRDLLRGLM